jgi:hypothetical protein
MSAITQEERLKLLEGTNVAVFAVGRVDKGRCCTWALALRPLLDLLATPRRQASIARSRAALQDG